MDFPNGADYTTVHRDSTSNVCALKIGRRDQKSWFNIKHEHPIHSPLLRIVGFESKILGASQIESESKSADSVHSLAVVSNVTNATVTNGTATRKRLLSPLKSMLCLDKIDGDSLWIGDNAYQRNSQDGGGSSGILFTHKHKKAHIVSSSTTDAHVWHPSSLLLGNTSPDKILGSNSNIFTDGPLFGNKQQAIHNTDLPQFGFNYF